MQIVAHRGASHDSPESTLAAARLAWAQEADALEVDVHLTRDGRLAVIHDSDTWRVAGVRRRVSETTLAELQQLDVGRWKGGAFAGERIPALEEVLAEVPAGKRVFVEVKSGVAAVPELLRCLRGASSLRERQATVIAFDFEVAVAAKRGLPDHEVCWLADSGRRAPRPTLDEVANVARAAGLDGIDVHAGWALPRETVTRISRDGFRVYVWTVDDPALARRLQVAGVQGIATNRPGWLRAQLAVRT